MSTPRGRMLGTGISAAALVAALLAAPQPALAAPTTVGPPIVTAGNTAAINDQAGIFGATSQANTVVQLSSTAAGGCATRPATTAAGGPWAATVLTKSSTSVGFTAPSGPPSGNNGALKSYNVCVYDASNTVSTTSNLLGSSVVFYGSGLAASPGAGMAGGGGPITVTTNLNSPIFTGVAAPSAVFVSGSCPGTLGTANPANLTATNVTKLSNNSLSLTVPSGVATGMNGQPGNYTICVYDGTAGTSGLLSLAQYQANLVGLSPGSGSYLTPVGVTANSPAAFLSGVATPAVLVVGPGAGCPGTYSTAPIGPVTPLALTTPGAVRRLTNNRAAVTIPPLTLQQPGQPTPYQVCFYANSTGTGSLLGTAAYMASVVASPTGVVPAAGPSSGGNMITVVGTDFPTEPGRITATLGGVPLTNIQPMSDKAFTATVPPHAVEGNVSLAVTTSAGTKVLPGAYSFLSPVKISPNTAPNTAPMVDIDVVGAGFMSVGFGPAGNARVFLVDGVYDGADAGGGVRANGPVADCVNVLPIADDELICTLQLNRRLNEDGSGFFDSVGYNRDLEDDVDTTAGSRIIVSAAKTFSDDDLGQPIAQDGGPTNIPAGSIITQILSPAKAVISQPSTESTSAPITATIGGVAVRGMPNALLTVAGSTNVTVAGGAAGFMASDVGRVFNATTGIPNGTTVVAVAPGGRSATLSAPASSSSEATLANVSISGGATTLTGAAIAAGDQYAIVGTNTLGIPVGTRFNTAGTGTAGLSAAAVGGGGPATITISRPATASLYAAAPVPVGSYHLTVVSNGMPDAALDDPGYWQSDVTSSSAFTVAPF